MPFILKHTNLNGMPWGDKEQLSNIALRKIKLDSQDSFLKGVMG